MLKRMKLIIAATLVAALMLCGWTAYASTSSNQATSTTIHGKLTALTADTITLHTDAGDQTLPLASSVWVYLNEQKAQPSDLQTGNEIEVILNNKKQVAYIKGTSGASATPSTSPSPTPVPSVQPTPVQEAPSPTAEPTSSPSTPKENKPAANPSGTLSDLKDMDVTVDGQHFNLHIKQNENSQGVQFVLRIQSPHAGNIHLTGAQAQAWIANLLGTLDLTSADAKMKLGQQLAQQYNLDAAKLNVHLNMHTKAREDQDDDDQDEDKNDGKNKVSEINKAPRNGNVEKSKDKNNGKSEDKEKNEKKHGNGNENRRD